MPYSCLTLALLHRPILRRPSLRSRCRPTPRRRWVPGRWCFNGKVYDSTTVEPIADAAVRYEVIASYFSEIQEGRPHATVTDAQGHFSLPMIVHDTDNIRIYAEAPGYAPYDAKLDLFGDRFLDIALVKNEQQLS